MYYYQWGMEHYGWKDYDEGCDSPTGHEWSDHHVEPRDPFIHSTCENCTLVKVTPRR